MAIDPSGMVMRLSPTQSLDLTGFQRAKEHQDQLRMRREQMRLQREQFEETKRQNAEMMQLRQMEEAGAMARQQLTLQQQREADEAKRLEAQTTARRNAEAEMRKYLDARDFEGADNLIPGMENLGMGVERGSDSEGNPTYRVVQDRAADEAAESAQLAQTSPYGETETAEQSLSRLGGMGYPDNERGNLDDPSADRAPLPTDEMLMAEPDLGGVDKATGEAFDPLSVARRQARNIQRPSSEVYGAAPRGLGPSYLSSGDAYAQALGASEYARQNNDQPLKGPDTEDMMGAVPKDTYDTGAMMANAKRRGGPALAALAQAYPEGPYRDSTEASNAAVDTLGLNPADAVKTANSLRSGPDAAIAKELGHERDLEKAKADAIPKPLTRPELIGLEVKGWERGEDVGKERGYENILANVKRAEMINKVLSDGNGANDDSILFQLTDLLGSRGTQSNNDLRVAAGIDATDTRDQIKEKLHRWILGGNTKERNKMLMAIVEASVDEDDQSVFGMLEALDDQIAAETDPEVRRGLEKYRMSVPKSYRDAFDGEEEDEEGAAPVERQGRTVVEGRETQRMAGSIEDDDEFMDAFQAAADDADLDPELILPLIGHESGGNPTAKNPGSSARGLIQFIDSVARGYTNPRTGKKFSGSAELAQLSRAEQAPIVIEYLKRNGVTSEHDQGDIYVAIAAPGFLNEEDTAEVYKKGTDDYSKNAHNWDLDNDGVITRGELYRWGMGERRKAGAAPAAKAKGGVQPGAGVLKRLSPTASLEASPTAEAAPKSQLDSEVDELTAD
jgi:hypothetical protein